jgi:hypothetical protein
MAYSFCKEMKSTFSIPIERISILVAVVCCLGCSKSKQARYPFLNSELNKNATITNAELRALYFERWASETGAGVNTSSDPPMRLQLSKAQVNLKGTGVMMIAQVDVYEPLAKLWMEQSSEDARAKDCKRLGNKAANQLAQFLECDPSLIAIVIESSTGQLYVPSYQAETMAEQVGSSNGG